MLKDVHSANCDSLGSSLLSDLSRYSSPLHLPSLRESHSTTPKTIAFVDSTIFDSKAVIAALKSDVVVSLDATQDGIAQIAETLRHYKDLTGIEIISHGSAARLQLGNSFLDASSLVQYAPQLQQWAGSFDSGADILIYGCNVAAGEVGQAFIRDLSTFTSADVAASTNPTGDPLKGGDWTLEYAIGSIETPTDFTSSFINTYRGVLATESIFTSTTTPSRNSLNDGVSYELGLQFRSTKAGQIQAIRYWKDASETGTHVGKIWSSTGQLLASVTFTNETASGWQQQVLPTALTIAPDTTYTISVNTNGYYAVTNNSLGTPITSGDLSTLSNGGVYGNVGSLPTQSFQSSNYYRDIVFAPTALNPNNIPGTITLSGTATQNQTLSASISDADGLNGVNISYQWQQSSDNGTSWNDITGATNQTLTLGQSQVSRLVRARATYIDALGSNEGVNSAATATVANVNDLGTIAISGTTAVGSSITATVADIDGLTGSTIAYQWQQLLNGTWTNLNGATNQALALDSSLVGKQIRVNATYVDTLGSSENIFSNPATISSTLNTLFTTQTPNQTNITDGFGSEGDYELGMEFRSAKAGTINAIRFYKASSETGTHVGRIWSSTGTLLATVNFTNETASGWQQQALTTPLIIQPNTTYVVSVNANSYYVLTANGISTTLLNGDLSAIADGSNGVFNTTPGLFPTQSWNNSNYFRDIVFVPTSSNSSNTPGTLTLNGTAKQNQTLTANVSDADGLTGVTINYQWQQLTNGIWTNIAGATTQTFSLAQTQVNQQVRVQATYIDAIGSSENLTSTATSIVINVNDTGVATVSGATAQGNVLTANVTDIDGLNGVTINYQWQQSSDGNTWTNISEATSQTLTLNSSSVGKQVRVLATYTDALGSSESIFSNPTNSIASSLNTLFTSTATPSITNLTDGIGYELGMEFKSAKAGQIQAIRYWKAPSETGAHIGRIWSSTGQLLASVTFANETASGWQQQALAAPLTIQPNTTYIVSVNTNSYYAITQNGLVNTLTNGDISAVADGSNGVFGSPSQFPTQSWQNSNYYRDIVFAPSVPSGSNTLGTIAINGTAAQNQSLSATVADADGLIEANVNYQWQQSSDNGITWTNISGAANRILTLAQAQVNKLVRVTASYTDALGSSENVISAATSAIENVNDPGLAILAGSATVGATLKTNIFDADGLTGAAINYQWQQFVNNNWSNIVGATIKSLTLTNALLGLQVRVLTNYIDALGSSETISSSAVTIAAQNAIVVENQKTGTTAWQIANQATNNEIAGFAAATSINKGEALPIKVSLSTPGQYKIDVYRLGYYGGAGGRFITSSGLLNGVTQAGPTIDSTTRLVEYKWNTSYTLQTGVDWTTGLYTAKLTDVRTGKESQVWFTVRDDNRPSDLGFQEAVTTTEAYNNYGGYSVYNENSIGSQKAYKVSFDRPFGLTNNVEGFNNRMTWEYNMVRWLESQGYDVSYYTNLDVHINPLQLYSQKTFLSVGHDEYWSMDMFNNVEKARDNGINLAFFSANTAYWRVRFEPSSTGQANRVMTVYKDNWALDPVAQKDPSAATTRFRSTQVNKPENALLGVMYTGNTGVGAAYGGFNYVVTNASDPYYAHTGLRNGDTFSGLVGYEWDAVVNNGLTPSGLVILSRSPVAPVGSPPPLPAGTDTSISNAVRYTASSGAKVFSTGTIQWSWGLDSYGLSSSRVDSRVRQMTVNVLLDMEAKPQTPDADIIVG